MKDNDKLARDMRKLAGILRDRARQDDEKRILKCAQWFRAAAGLNILKKKLGSS